jgi:MATE family, multidrug efflux pump
VPRGEPPGGAESSGRPRGNEAGSDGRPDSGVEPSIAGPGRGRQILSLAVPAFLTLVVEPLFLLADSAIVGHLGTAELAGLGIASTILLTAVGLFVFLAYATTAAVGRQIGAGRSRQAIALGMDGLYLALALGALLASALAATAPWLVGVFDASPAAQQQAVVYLRISAIGIPAMLSVLAVTGVLRGVLDTRTPLIVSVAGFSTNVVLNVVLVYGVGLGIAGSAVGTVIAQTGMALVLVAVLIRLVRRHRARLAPSPMGVLSSARDGLPLLVRTISLRLILLLSAWVAAGLGDVTLAAHQVAFTVWNLLTFALDALAIAAQALTGRSLGAGDAAGTRATTRLMVRWGLLCGFGLGLVLLLASAWVPSLFSTDPEVRRALGAALILVAAGQVVSGYVFVLDGVLIGAGDARWLAAAMAVLLIMYLPIIGWLRIATPWLVQQGPVVSTLALWSGFTVFMLVRALTLWWRARSDHWLVLGAESRA